MNVTRRTFLKDSMLRNAETGREKLSALCLQRKEEREKQELQRFIKRIGESRFKRMINMHNKYGVEK